MFLPMQDQFYNPDAFTPPPGPTGHGDVFLDPGALVSSTNYEVPLTFVERVLKTGEQIVKGTGTFEQAAYYQAKLNVCRACAPSQVTYSQTVTEKGTDVVQRPGVQHGKVETKVQVVPEKFQYGEVEHVLLPKSVPTIVSEPLFETPKTTDGTFSPVGEPVLGDAIPDSISKVPFGAKGYYNYHEEESSTQATAILHPPQTFGNISVPVHLDDRILSESELPGDVWGKVQQLLYKPFNVVEEEPIERHNPFQTTQIQDYTINYIDTLPADWQQTYKLSGTKAFQQAGKISGSVNYTIPAEAEVMGYNLIPGKEIGRIDTYVKLTVGGGGPSGPETPLFEGEAKPELTETGPVIPGSEVEGTTGVEFECGSTAQSQRDESSEVEGYKETSIQTEELGVVVGEAKDSLAFERPTPLVLLKDGKQIAVPDTNQNPPINSGEGPFFEPTCDPTAPRTVWEVISPKSPIYPNDAAMGYRILKVAGKEMIADTPYWDATHQHNQVVSYNHADGYRDQHVKFNYLGQKEGHAVVSLHPGDAPTLVYTQDNGSIKCLPWQENETPGIEVIPVDGDDVVYTPRSVTTDTPPEAIAPVKLPTTGEEFTIQENDTGKCIYFDYNSQDGAKDWLLRSETCDPTDSDLNPKFLWSYNPLSDAGLESQGWRGLIQSNRIPDMPGIWYGGDSQWGSGQPIRGYHTQTNDPDARVKWEPVSSAVSKPVVDGGVSVKINTSHVSGAPGYWALNSGANQVEAKNWTGEKQHFTVKVHEDTRVEPIKTDKFTIQATNDPDARVKWLAAPDSKPVVDGGVSVRINTSFVTRQHGFWSLNGSSDQIEAKTWSNQGDQFFTIKDYEPAPVVSGELPKKGDAFTIQEHTTGKCLYFDSSEAYMDGAKDWGVRSEPCDPASPALDPKFLWSYTNLPDADGANLEAQGWHGLSNNGRFPDMPGFWNKTSNQWASGQDIRGWVKQTNDPDARVKWEPAADEQPLTAGGVAVKVETTPVDNKTGYWNYDANAATQLEARHSAAVKTQLFTVRIRTELAVPRLDADEQVAEEEDALAAAEEEAQADADAQEAMLAEAPAAATDECLPFA
eukprot:tig00021438_g21445.t1